MQEYLLKIVRKVGQGGTPTGENCLLILLILRVLVIFVVKGINDFGRGHQTMAYDGPGQLNGGKVGHKIS